MSIAGKVRPVWYHGCRGGGGGSIQNWVNTFLTERSQVVKVNNTESQPASVLSGKLEGNVLGPVLFAIYINDLPETVKSDKLLFPDDIKSMRTIMTRVDACTLQNGSYNTGHRNGC